MQFPHAYISDKLHTKRCKTVVQGYSSYTQLYLEARTWPMVCLKLDENPSHGVLVGFFVWGVMELVEKKENEQENWKKKHSFRC